MRRGIGWRTWAVLSALLLPLVASAQTIRGQVVDSRDSLAVPGVLVQLIDDRGALVARALTNERGEYRLSGVAAGPHHVRILRIGYRPADAAPVQLAFGAEVVRDIALSDVPISLDTVRVLARNVCNAPSDTATSTAPLWQQAHTALTATVLTARSRPIGATLVSFDRVLDPSMRRIRQQSAVVRSGVSTRVFVSITADSLRRVGYVATGRDGWNTYNAPDLDVLLSPEFAEDHCFRLASSSDRTHIGIAFEPNPDRATIPEISGTLWIDRKSAELRRMEFRYVNVPLLQAQQAGGEMEFARLRTGAWLISRWAIRMPVLRSERTGDVPGMPSTQIRVAEVRVAGGVLASVTRGRDTIWKHDPLLVSGTVEDSVSRRPIAGARVGLRGTQVLVVTDARGRFAIPNALPGQYVLEARNAPLDSLAPVHGVPIVVTDAAVQVRLRLPSTKVPRQ